jgi:antitoxin PrlF
MPAATVTSKGQITLPAELRADLDIQPGDRIVFYTTIQGRRGFRVSRPRFGSGQGIVTAERSFTLAELDEALTDALAEKYAPSASTKADRR